MTETHAAGQVSRYAVVLESVLTTVESMPSASLRLRCPEEHCSAAALAGHIAAAQGVVGGWIKTAQAGGPMPPVTMEDIDRGNAEQTTRDDQLSKDEVLARLRANGATMTAILKGLSDDDLVRSAPFALFGGETSVQSLVDHAVIGHMEHHLASLRAVAGNAAPPTAGV